MNERGITRSLWLALPLLALSADMRPALAYDAELVWMAVAGASGYKVYRREAGRSFATGSDVGLAAPGEDGFLHHVARSLSPNSPSYFAVTAYDRDGAESPFSNEIAVTDPSLPTPAGTATPTPPTADPTPNASATGGSTPRATPTATLAPSAACPTNPTNGCRTARRSFLYLNRNDDGRRDKFVWKWTRGKSTSQAEFGDPSRSTEHLLCVYAAAPVEPRLGLWLPPGADGWRRIATGGRRYKNRGGAAGAIRTVVLQASERDRARILVVGRGAGLPDADLERLFQPVIVQLLSLDTSVCWESRFEHGDRIESDARHFKAKAVD